MYKSISTGARRVVGGVANGLPTGTKSKFDNICFITPNTYPCDKWMSQASSIFSNFPNIWAYFLLACNRFLRPSQDRRSTLGPSNATVIPMRSQASRIFRPQQPSVLRRMYPAQYHQFFGLCRLP